MNTVYFENGKIYKNISDADLALHLKMQHEYNFIYEQRDIFAQNLKEKIQNSAIDITEQCMDEYKNYCMQFEPELNLCMKYNLTSLLPDLSIKITKYEKVD